MIILYGAPLVYSFLFYCTQNLRKKFPLKSRMLNCSHMFFNQARVVGSQWFSPVNSTARFLVLLVLAYR